MARPWPNSSSYRDRPSPRPGLATIVQRAQTFTNASGAAVALIRNNGREMECCVRSGRSAPPLGKSALYEGSLVAVSIASGQQLWCHDVKTDPRMRGAALFDPGIRSLVFTPIAQGGQIIGILAVFSESTDAFTAKHLIQLETDAAELSQILGMEGRGSSRSLPTAEADAMGSDADTPKPPASVRQPLPPKKAREAALEQAVERQGKLDRQQTAGSAASHRFATLEAMASPQSRSRNKLIAGATLALVLLAVASAVYLAVAWHSAPRQTMIPTVQTPAPNVSSAAAAAGGQAILKINPETIGTRKGSTFLLNLTFAQAADIGSVALEVDYDPKLLQFISVSDGGFLAQDGRQVVLAHRDDPFAGALKISAQRPPGSAGVSGEGILFGVVFWARQKGAGSVSIVPGVRDSQGRAVEVAGSQASVAIR